MSTDMSYEVASRQAASILDEVEKAVVGKREAAELVLTGLLAGGHVLVEDVPGVAKTLLVRSIGQVSGLSFSRIQFTPDLMPADVTGSSVYDTRSSTVEFRPGPLFANLVLGDEINRAPPKTQAALLEAMQEQQVTAEGSSHPLPDPFSVIATQNPIEYEGTYPLPEAQLDRFLLKVRVGYPSDEQETALVRARAARGHEEPDLRQVADAGTIRSLRKTVESVEIAEAVASYLVEVVRATRQLSGVLIGASPRASVALLQVSRARAVIHGRGYVLPDDVKDLAETCLGHRLSLRPELWLRGVAPGELIGQAVGQVPVPVGFSSSAGPRGPGDGSGKPSRSGGGPGGPPGGIDA